MGCVAASIILVFLSIPALALVLVVAYVLLRLVSLACSSLGDLIRSVTPEEHRRWAELGPDEEEMKMIEDEIRGGNIRLT